MVTPAKHRTAATTSSSRRTHSHHSKRPLPIRSFHVATSDEPFLVMRLTSQTFYWLVIGALVLTLGLWVLHMATNINKMYDDVDAMNTQPDIYSIANVRHHPLVQPQKNTSR